MEAMAASAMSTPASAAFTFRSVQIEPGRAPRVIERSHDRIEIGLAGLPAHGSDGGIGDVDARVRGLQDRGCVDAAGIVRMKVDRDADLPAQRLHQLLRRIGTADRKS